MLALNHWTIGLAVTTSDSTTLPVPSQAWPACSQSPHWPVSGL